MPRTPEGIIRLLRAWVNGDSSYFGTVPCLIEQDDRPISTILIEAGELALLAVIRRLAPQRREELERRLLAEKEARRLIFRDLVRRSRISESTSTFCLTAASRPGSNSLSWQRQESQLAGCGAVRISRQLSEQTSRPSGTPPRLLFAF